MPIISTISPDSGNNVGLQEVRRPISLWILSVILMLEALFWSRAAIVDLREINQDILWCIRQQPVLVLGYLFWIGSVGLSATLLWLLFKRPTRIMSVCVWARIGQLVTLILLGMRYDTLGHSAAFNSSVSGSWVMYEGRVTPQMIFTGFADQFVSAVIILIFVNAITLPLFLLVRKSIRQSRTTPSLSRVG